MSDRESVIGAVESHGLRVYCPEYQVPAFKITLRAAEESLRSLLALDPEAVEPDEASLECNGGYPFRLGVAQATLRHAKRLASRALESLERAQKEGDY